MKDINTKRSPKAMVVAAAAAALAVLAGIAATHLSKPEKAPVSVSENPALRPDPNKTKETGAAMSEVIDGDAIDRMAREKLGPVPSGIPPEKLLAARNELAGARAALEASRHIREIQRTRGTAAALKVQKRRPAAPSDSLRSPQQ